MTVSYTHLDVYKRQRVYAARTHARTVVLEVPRKAVAPCLLHDEPSGILVCLSLIHIYYMLDYTVFYACFVSGCLGLNMKHL